MYDLFSYLTEIETEYKRCLFENDFDRWAIFSGSRNRALREYIGSIHAGSESAIKAKLAFESWSLYSEHIRTGIKQPKLDEIVTINKRFMTGEITVEEYKERRSELV